jgi:hypothetical protein
LATHGKLEGVPGREIPEDGSFCRLATSAGSRFAAGGMRRLLLVSTAVLAALLPAGCGERGDQAIAYGAHLGQDWKPPAGAKQLRIAVQNSFTRDVIVYADAPGAHYELTVSPISERYMIVPEAKYEISATTEGQSTGMTRLWVEPDNRNGGKGFLVKIRP